jgi:hypothetical protein
MDVVEGARRRGRIGRLLITLAIVVAAIAWLPPLTGGFHLGYNSATDTACETRLGVQWCKHSATAEESPGAQSAAAASETREADAKRSREEAAAERSSEEVARAREAREEAGQPQREAAERKRNEREALESEGK